MKKDKKRKSRPLWVDQLFDGSLEIVFAVFVIAAALILVYLLPSNLIEDVPLEILELFSVMIVLIVGGFILLMCHLIGERKKAKELRKIYNILKPKYNLTLMTVTRKKGDQMVDFPIIRGKRSEGKFELSKDGDGFIFSVECLSGPIEGRKSEVYLASSDEAIVEIEKYMSANEEHKRSNL